MVEIDAFFTSVLRGAGLAAWDAVVAVICSVGVSVDSIFPLAVLVAEHAGSSSALSVKEVVAVALCAGGFITANFAFQRSISQARRASSVFSEEVELLAFGASRFCSALETMIRLAGIDEDLGSKVGGGRGADVAVSCSLALLATAVAEVGVVANTVDVDLSERTCETFG